MKDKESLFSFRIKLCLPWRFWPRTWFGYWRPKRITASYREPYHVYRWFWLFIAPKGWPK